MSLVDRPPLFTCDCCGAAMDAVPGSFANVSLPGLGTVQLCNGHDCAEHAGTNLGKWLIAQVMAHQALIVDGVTPSHPLDS